ncbi:hypothetical protein CLV59_103273 [Chitinophaga dinghuensis]|uniref:Uncharacterized protein n=1 Tax=Chitinophaga dinghuensis TaxID=1539050 RepID=A0A327W243_9BACT|nr:hypothetical protein CLV59_103273 [Chitinophaga dinghuensis]
MPVPPKMLVVRAFSVKAMKKNQLTEKKLDQLKI